MVSRKNICKTVPEMLQYNQIYLQSYGACSGSLKGNVSGEHCLWTTEIVSEKATYHDE